MLAPQRIPYGWRREGEAVVVDRDAFAVLATAAYHSMQGSTWREIEDGFRKAGFNVSRATLNRRTAAFSDPILWVSLAQELEIDLLDLEVENKSRNK